MESSETNILKDAISATELFPIQPVVIIMGMYTSDILTPKDLLVHVDE